MTPPGPLVAVDWLHSHIDDTALRIVDTRWYLGEPGRGRAAYEQGHIPGAAYVDLERHLSTPTGPGRHPLPSHRAFAATLGRLGIGNQHTVVAYDDRGGAVAARMWWMLRHVGHGAAAVLDGGLPAWEGAGLATSIQPVLWPACEFRAALRSGDTVDAEQLLSILGTVRLLDARGGERYRGESEPIDPIAGHIPTAVNAPCEANLDAEGSFLPPDQLAARYRRLGVADAASAVVYCGSGVTACHDILAMEAAGMGTARLYPGSWSDWSGSDRPVAVGPEPGSP